MVVLGAICTIFIQFKKTIEINNIERSQGVIELSECCHKIVKSGISGLCINSAGNTAQTVAKCLNFGGRQQALGRHFRPG